VNILQFPTNETMTWAVIEKGIRNFLLASNLEIAAVDWILNDLEPRFIAFMKSQPPISLPTEMANFTQIVKDISIESAMRMFSQLMVLEIELYHAKFDRD